jgi:hypothetical protein
MNKFLSLTEWEKATVLEEATRAKNNRFCRLELIWRNAILSGGSNTREIDKDELKRKSIDNQTDGVFNLNRPEQ